MSEVDRSIAAKVMRQGGVYSACRLVERLLALVMVPIYAHYLAAAGYGTVAVLSAVSAPLAIAFAQGLMAAWVRLRFEYGEGEARRRFESTLVWYLLASVVVLLGIVVAAGDLLASWVLPEIPFYPLGLLACITAAGQVFSDLYLRQLQAEQKPGVYLGFTLARTLGTMLGVVVLVVGYGLGPLGKVGAECGAALLFAVASIVLLRPAHPRDCDFSLLRRSLVYSVPLVPHSLLGQLNRVASVTVVSLVLGVATAGVFSMGLAIARLGNAVAMALNQAYHPIFAQGVVRAGALGPEGDEERAGVARAGLVVVGFVAILALGLCASAREVLALLTTPEFDESWRVVAPLAAAAVAQACYFVASQSVLFRSEGTRRIGLLTGLAVAVNVLGSLFLLPRIGIMGAALSLLCSNLVLALLTARLGQLLTPMPHRSERWVLLLLVTALGLFALFQVDTHLAGWLPRVAAKVAVVALASSGVWFAAGATSGRGLVLPDGGAASAPGR